MRMPSAKQLKKRREPKFVLDIKQITNKDIIRIKAWAAETMRKHEHKLNNQWRHLQIVATGEIEPEDVDVKVIYPYKDLRWMIHKEHNLWVLTLISRRTILAVSKFAQI